MTQLVKSGSSCDGPTIMYSTVYIISDFLLIVNCQIGGRINSSLFRRYDAYQTPTIKIRKRVCYYAKRITNARPSGSACLPNGQLDMPSTIRGFLLSLSYIDPPVLITDFSIFMLIIQLSWHYSNQTTFDYNVDSETSSYCLEDGRF